MQSNRTKASNKSGSPAWLQTLVFTGSLATTVVGAGLISQLDMLQNSTSDSSSTEIGTDSVVLEPIPTVMDIPSTNGAPVNLPTATPPVVQNGQSPAVMPTDIAPATIAPTPTAPEPIATPVVQQQSSQRTVTPRVRSRTRSSR